MIKDSGNRREFDTGAVRDIQEGKGRMDLLPWAAIMEVSKHCENGAQKYGEHNVDKGLNTSSFADSGARHLAKWLDGWDDEPHLLAAAWNLLWAIQMEIKHPELCDVPWKETKHENDHLCCNCKHFALSMNAKPCVNCSEDKDKWEEDSK